MERIDNYSPFRASGGSWGTTDNPAPQIAAALTAMQQCLCSGGLMIGTGGTNVQYLSSASELRGSNVYGYRYMAYLEYLETPEGGGGGWFVFRIDSTTADDGADVLKPDGVADVDAGRWERLSAS